MNLRPTPHQTEKALAFQALHAGPGLFVAPNPWDAGSARLLQQLGFQALASTGAGLAFASGCPDTALGPERLLAQLRALCAATELPVTADLENGFGEAPEAVARSIALAAEAGAVGGSIDDSSGRPQAPQYPLSLAVERIEAAVEAARRLPFAFTLTARAENFFCGDAAPDLDDTLRRLQAYERAGADVLFAPGLRSLQDIATVLGALQRPVNVMMGFAGADFGLAELAALGVRRVSLGGSLARAALGALRRAAEEVLQQGRFSYADQAIAHAELNQCFARAAGARA